MNSYPSHLQEVLVVDDEPLGRRLIRQHVAALGCTVRECATGEEALASALARPPDVALVDVQLPGINGFEVCRQLTADLRTADTPVIVVTARAGIEDLEAGFEAGATDYIRKPFNPRELVARVRSILRRTPCAGREHPTRARRYASFLGWTLDCAANTLKSPEGVEHLLSTAETQVLREFVERPHQILTREQLLGQRDLSPLDRSIDVRISRIRRKIEADSQNPRIIKTVYGAGYMFTANVTWS